jgi:cell division protein FtsI (penicillin-binding protein 3)
MAFCLLFAGAVVSRAGYIQLVNDKRLEHLARRQFQSKVLVRPRRGQITDRNGEPLAINLELGSLAANPTKIQNKKTLARLLSKATDLTYAQALKKLEEKREFVWIKRQMGEPELNRLRKWRILDAGGDLISGLWLVKESKRVYPHGELAAHVLGDVNVDSEGTEGTELWLNDRMRGKVVSVTAIKDALGRPTFIDSEAAKSVEDGEPVALTIDASLQYAVEEELRAAVHKSSARGGAVIVMNAVNGEVLAMANQPAFNPNEKVTSPDRRRNRVLTDGYEPGSTMKAVLLAGALSHGSRLTDQVYAEHGLFKVQGKKIGEAEAHEKFDWISLRKVIQVSSNIGAAKLALKLGADHYYNTLKAFGFGGRTDIGFPGEIPGRVPSRKSWQPLTVANVGFGQGVLVTPMQMTRAYATFLNGGWLVQPTLLKTDVPGMKPQAPRRILNEKVAADVVEALSSVTQDGGTGLKANLGGYRVAGKTGTAQVVDPVTHAYSRSAHIASFIGYALDVEPKIVIFTALDEPRGVYYASETAAPLFREVLNAVAGRFGLPAKSDPAHVLAAARAAKNKSLHASETENSAPDTLKVSQAKVQWAGTSLKGVMSWKMPSLKGLTPREAIRALQGHPFNLEMHGSGVVRTQAPEEGKTVADGETVRLSLAE